MTIYFTVALVREWFDLMFANEISNPEDGLFFKIWDKFLAESANDVYEIFGQNFSASDFRPTGILGFSVHVYSLALISLRV